MQTNSDYTIQEAAAKFKVTPPTIYLMIRKGKLDSYTIGRSRRITSESVERVRKAINAKCRQCTHDPSDAGSAAQQIACCTVKECPLHSVRPITCKSLPARLLKHWRLSEQDLCERARQRVERSTPSSVATQFDDLQAIPAASRAQVLVGEVRS